MLEKLKDAYLNAQLKGDRREALRLLLDQGINAGIDLLDLQQDVIAAAQKEIGRLWQENRISIAQEHQATAISQVVLAHLYDRAEPAPRNGRRVLVGCVEGELHDFPARLAADALDLSGFEVSYLGANVPTDSLLTFIAESRPDLVALSVSMTFNVGSLRTAVARIQSAFDPAPGILVGGHACQWEASLSALPGVSGVGRDARELVTLAKDLLLGGEGGR